jgi:hypothetical protein
MTESRLVQTSLMGSTLTAKVVGGMYTGWSFVSPFVEPSRW